MSAKKRKKHQADPPGTREAEQAAQSAAETRMERKSAEGADRKAEATRVERERVEGRREV